MTDTTRNLIVVDVHNYKLLRNGANPTEVYSGHRSWVDGLTIWGQLPAVEQVHLLTQQEANRIVEAKDFKYLVWQV